MIDPRVRLLANAASLLATAGFVFAQSALPPKAPPSFSATEVITMKGPEVFKTYRDGNLLVIESIEGSHRSRVRVDFSSKVAYSWNPADPDDGCERESVRAQGGESVDPFGWSQYFMKAANEHEGAHQTGTASINGVALKILETSGDQEKMKIGHDPVTGLVWRAELIVPGEPPHLIVELKSFTTGKPPASEFAIPASCSKLPAAAPKPPPADFNFANAEAMGKVDSRRLPAGN